jgi:hypothetical protein
MDGTVGLAPSTNPPFSGTRWRAALAPGEPTFFTLQCLGEIDGPRFLDGRTMDGTVGLAPNTEPPFTGTVWDVREEVLIDEGTNLIPADE